MDIEMANKIGRMLEGHSTQSALATVCIALIHMAATHGYTKEEGLKAFAGQWDLYEKRHRPQEPEPEPALN